MIPQTAKQRMGDTLRIKRREKGLTLKQLAKASGCHLSAICHIEKGRREPRIALLSRIAQALGLTINDLVT